MHRLTAFEFLSPTDTPQLVRLSRRNPRATTPLFEFNVVIWLGMAFTEETTFLFASPGDLVIEGYGIGRPYWDGEIPQWPTGFDGRAEGERIAIMQMALKRQLEPQGA